MATCTRTGLARSALARAGGAVVIRPVDGRRLAALRDEAHDRHTVATESRSDRPDDGERGRPDRWLESAPGGPALDALMADPALLDELGRLTGGDIEPLGLRGTFSYYRRQGHHLGLHRDIRRCDLTVVTCVEVTGAGHGGDLDLFVGQAAAPLAAVRARGDTGGRRLSLRPGEAAVLLGGIIPHRVTPIVGERVRIVAPLCYTFAGVPSPPGGG